MTNDSLLKALLIPFPCECHGLCVFFFLFFFLKIQEQKDIFRVQGFFSPCGVHPLRSVVTQPETHKIRCRPVKELSWKKSTHAVISEKDINWNTKWTFLTKHNRTGVVCSMTSGADPQCSTLLFLKENVSGTTSSGTLCIYSIFYGEKDDALLWHLYCIVKHPQR